jgi:hypothetical protein
VLKVENSKENFINLYNQNIKRQGATKLLEWINNSDFFTAPASTKFHLSCEGGLCLHSINVFNELSELMPDFNKESLAICGLLHDICKINFYEVSTRNVKNDATGQWEKVLYYSVNEKFPFGHGEKSVFLIENFLKLTVNEAVAIRFHMGAFEGEKAWGNVSSAFEKFTLAFYTHFADMKATYISENSEGKNK